MSYQKLSLVIPVWNEQATLESLLERVEAVQLPIDVEIVLVDDGSTDKSREILESLKNKRGYVVLFNEHNMGKSQTVKRGLLSTTGDLVVIQDADLEYDPADLRAFVALFQEGQADVVYGNRFGKNNRVIYPQNWIGNTALSYVSALFTGLRAGMWTRDMEVCYKMANGNVYRQIAAKLTSRSRFGLEPELTARFAKYKLNGQHLRFYQLPINYFPRTIAEGKHMSATKDGIKALWEILKYNIWA